jgi:hypothetical protein
MENFALTTVQIRTCQARNQSLPLHIRLRNKSVTSFNIRNWGGDLTRIQDRFWSPIESRCDITETIDTSQCNSSTIHTLQESCVINAPVMIILENTDRETNLNIPLEFHLDPLGIARYQLIGWVNYENSHFTSHFHLPGSSNLFFYDDMEKIVLRQGTIDNLGSVSHASSIGKPAHSYIYYLLDGPSSRERLHNAQCRRLLSEKSIKIGNRLPRGVFDIELLTRPGIKKLPMSLVRGSNNITSVYEFDKPCTTATEEMDVDKGGRCDMDIDHNTGKYPSQLLSKY